jgi:hypothetical protein
MRAGVWLWLSVSAGLPACAGDYPLSPTPCDDYCHATKGLQCDFYSPASCVAQCENDGRGAASCRLQLNAVVACFNGSDASEQRCSFSNYGPGVVFSCEAELTSLNDCTFLQQFGE